MKIIVPYTIDDSSLVSNSVAETDPLYNAATTYGEGDIVRRDTTHRRYESQVSGNLGNTPESSDKWLDIGPTNPWAMFDQKIGTQTEAADAIEAVVQITGRADSVALLNIAGNTATIVARNSNGDEIYNEAFNLQNTNGINNWGAYFFAPLTKKTALIVTDLPIDYAPEITVTLSIPGGVAKIGSLIIGRSTTLGVSLYSPTIGIRDYSRKEPDEYGEYSVVERAFSKRGGFRVWCDNLQLDPVVDILETVRATPVVWVVTDETGAPFSNATTIFGFYKDWSTEIQYATRSLCTLDVEGLT